MARKRSDFYCNQGRPLSISRFMGSSRPFSRFASRMRAEFASDSAQKIVRIESVQNRWNPADQRVGKKNGVFDACERHHMTYISYSPVGGGRGHEALANILVLKELALKYQASPYQIMLAWFLWQRQRLSCLFQAQAMWQALPIV